MILLFFIFSSIMNFTDSNCIYFFGSSVLNLTVSNYEYNVFLNEDTFRYIYIYI